MVHSGLSPTDDTLIEEALAGNKMSLEKLIKRYQDYIYNISLRLFLDPDDALDATQEVLIKVITHLKTFKGQSKFSTWLYRIAFNYFLSSSQRKMEKVFEGNVENYAESYAGLAAPEEAPEASEIQKEEVRILCSMAMLMCLNREQRLVYIIGEIFEANHHLGAELFEISPTNFRVKLHRAKADLLAFVSGKCGLINPENPCRCPKKAKMMLSKGLIVKEKILFNTDFNQKIKEVVQDQKDAISDEIQFNLKELFQDSPFQIKEQLDALLSDIVK